MKNKVYLTIMFDNKIYLVLSSIKQKKGISLKSVYGDLCIFCFFIDYIMYC